MNTDSDWEYLSEPVDLPDDASDLARKRHAQWQEREEQILNWVWAVIYTNARSQRMIGSILSLCSIASLAIHLRDSGVTGVLPLLLGTLFVSLYFAIDGHETMKETLESEAYYRETGIIRRRKRRWWIF